MKPTTSNRFVRAVSASLLCLHGVASAVDYNIDAFTGSTFLWTDTTPWNPDIIGGPLGTDNIVISGDIITGDTTINYATGTAATRSIGNITVTDTNLAATRSFNFSAGVAGSHLQFATTTPTVSTNITNVGSGAQRLTIQNPLFQSGTTFTKGGTGQVRLDFITADSASSFSSNVTSLASSGAGDLWLSNSSGASMALPTVSFATNNTRLTVSGGTFTTTNNIATGTNEIYVGGNGTLTLNGSATLSGNGFTLSSNNSAYHYMGGSSTVNYSSSATSSIGRIRWGEQWQHAGTSALNVTSGVVNITSAANNSFAGNPSNDANNTQNVVLNVSGGAVNFTSATSADFNFGTSTRNNATIPGALTTVAGNLTISGTGTLDLGTGTRLVLANRNATNTIVNVNSDLNLNGGTLRTAREIARGTIGTGAGTTRARVFLNGGTLTTTAAITDLFTAFTGANDGIFISSGGAVINTNGFNSGIAAVLQQNASSTGGGLTKNGTGTLTLSAANTFTGDTKVNAGTLTLGNASALQNSTFDSSGAGALGFGTLATATFGGLKGSNNLSLQNTTPAAVTLTVGGNNQSTTFSGNLTGLGGLTKTGSGTLTLSGTNSYAGNLTVSSGTVLVANTGALPGHSTNGRFSVASGAILALGNGVSDTDAAAIAGTTNFVSGSSLGFDTTAGNRSFAGVIGGARNITKLGANTLTISAAQTTTGTLSLAQGTVALAGGANTLASGSSVNFTGSATLDLGGNAQTLRNLTNGAGSYSSTITNGSLTITGHTGDLNFSPAQTANGQSVTLNMSGLAAFTYNDSARAFQAGGGGSDGNSLDLRLSATANTITASRLSLDMGGSDGSWPFNGATLRLGQTNSFRIGNGTGTAIQLSGYRSSGNSIVYQAGLTNPTLEIRASDGTSRAGGIIVAQASSGTNSGQPITASFDLGVVNALVGDVVLADTVQGGTGVAVTGAMTMAGGTFDATSMVLGRVNLGAAPSNINTLTGTFTQNGGTARIGTLTLGNVIAPANPTGTLPNFASTYALATGATLEAGTINANPSGLAFRATSNRTIDLAGGTLRHIAGGNLTVNGADSTTGGRINVDVTAASMIDADSGRSVTLGANTALTGSANISKTGGGSLVVNGSSSTYTGTLSVNAGTLGGVTTLGGAINLASAGTIAPGNSIGTISADSLVWEGLGLMSFELSNVDDTSDLLSLTGAFTRGSGTTFLFDFNGTGLAGETYTLVTFGSTNFSLSDFAYSNLSGANTGEFAMNANSLTFTVVPEPAAALLGGFGLLTLLRRRRS